MLTETVETEVKLDEIGVDVNEICGDRWDGITSVPVRVAMIVHGELECGPMSNVMAALPNIAGALCSMPQSLTDAQYWNSVQ